MTKLEELTALLVNEINDFNKGIEKLEKITEQINITRIKMDLTEYKNIIETNKQHMASHKDTLERFESRFNNKIKEAKIYPTWGVVVFVISILFSIGSITYAFKVKLNSDNIEKETYENGTASHNDSIQLVLQEKLNAN
tara:strand:+ start:336 stop:752 length:417 start_codon:yes stop_codon:yes gene_type:complete